MAEIDIDELASALSEEAPAGEDLEYSPSFTELERLLAEADAAENDADDTGVEPDWRAIDNLAHDLLHQTRDLRVVAIACRSALQQDGLSGYRQHLGLMRALIVNLWDHVHPQLDPDDDNDPTMRMNILSSLSDSMTALLPLRATPIVDSRALGRFSWRHMLLANGELSLPENSEETLTAPATISAAFMDADLEALQTTSNLIAEALQEVDTIEQTTTELVGSSNAISLEELRKMLAAMQRGMETQIAGLTGGEVPTAADESADTGGGAVASGGVPGNVSNRRDVVAALDRIVAYYRKSEPSSPIPVLLERAKRLVDMDFMEIIQDMAPDGVAQIEVFRGEPAGDSSAESSEDDGWGSSDSE